MRRWVSIGAVLVAGLLAGDVASVAAPGPRVQTADSREAVVDVELVLAVDVSYSMDMDELAIQREGYAQAIVSKEFLQALKTGPNGKVAVTYFEWAASTDQKLIIPWRIIDGPESADAVAAEIMKTPIRRASRTSISGAINFAMPLFEANAYRGLRKVIDISGDGPNNNGSPVTLARDEAVGKGIVINGLPIMLKEPSYSTMDIDKLDQYYEDCVVGGPGAFVITIKDREKFKEAIRTKLVMEVAHREPELRVVPVAAPAPAREPRVNCMIGEKIWQDRWGGRYPFIPAQAESSSGKIMSFFVYMLASQRNGTLYIGMTDDLTRRVWQHRTGAIAGFTKKYGVKQLVWYELHESRIAALTRERQMKKWNRGWKLRLIESCNPEWIDLWSEITA